MVLFSLGVLYSILMEWLLHRFLFHGLGKSRDSRFSFHWFEHHGQSRRHKMIDPDYQGSVFAWSAYGREVFGALIGVGLHLPIAALSPAFFLGVAVFGLMYQAVHRRSHLDPDWCREWLPWHYDHHMGPNPDANFGVLCPLFDHVFGTRKVWLGSEQYHERKKRDSAR